MELNYILEFVELIDAGKFSEAADRLFLSQSSLSKHMKALETELGVPLFQRETKRKVILSEYGKLYLPYAEQISILHKEYLALQKKQLQSSTSTLKLGSIPSMSPYHITELLAEFQARQPGLVLNVEELDSAAAYERIRQGKLDCAFVRETPGLEDEALEHIRYTFDTLCAVLNRSHPLAGEKQITLNHLWEEPFLLLKEPSFMYKMCIEACEKAGFTPNVVYTGSRGDNIVNMVGRGAGVALLTKRPIAMLNNPDVVMVDITPAITTEINLVCAREAEKSKELKQFLWFLQEQTEE